MAVALHPPWHFRRGAKVAAPATPVARRRIRRRPTGMTVARVRLGSVLRFALLFFVEAAALLVFLSIALWHLAARAGTIGWFEDLMVDLGFETFEIDPDRSLRVVLVGAGALVVLGTLAALVAAALFNAVCRITGGVEIVVRGQLPPEQRRAPGHGGI